MKPGEIAKLGERRYITSNGTFFHELPPSSDLEWAKRDAVEHVSNGDDEAVYIVKVLAVVRRSARIEE